MVAVTSGGLAQVGKFGVVGILNTLIEFSIFNALSGKQLKYPKIVANTCSTSVAMLFSFFANREGVFNGSHGNPVTEVILFFVATGFGIYVLQNAVLYLLLYRWSWPTKLVTHFLRVTKLKQRFSLDFTLRNGGKAAATVVSLTWNFFLYKYVVFK